jgi:membrane-bound lytic murein transglycosylase D
LRELNPELVQWCTPPAFKGYKFRVPAGSAPRFRKNYAAIPEAQKKNYIVHTVRRGETLASVAHKYGVSTALVSELNNVSLSKRLSRGRSIVVPVPRGGERYAAAASTSRDDDISTRMAKASAVQEEAVSRMEEKWERRQSASRTLVRSSIHTSRNPKDNVKLAYRVKKGDTIGNIAEWYACRAADIRNWNDISYRSRIVAGTTLAIWVPKSELKRFEKIDDMSFAEKEETLKHAAAIVQQEAAVPAQTNGYIVRDGDTLEEIAADHNVSVKQIQRWNNLRSTRIRVGQELLIHTGQQPASMAAKSTATGSEQTRATNDKRVLTYVVKKGDTLWDIAKAHNVAEAELKAWNDLKRSKIFAGQELVIHTDRLTSTMKE